MINNLQKFSDFITEKFLYNEECIGCCLPGSSWLYGARKAKRRERRAEPSKVLYNEFADNYKSYSKIL